MRIGVTGGAGFIGSHVVDCLVAAGHDVAVVDMRAPHRSDVAYFEADILDGSGLSRATRGCDALFHLAGVADVNHAAADPVGTAEANVVGTTKVWEAARNNDVGRVILASTVWVYSAARGDGPLTEDTPLWIADAGHVYTSSKIAAEMLVHNYLELYGQEFTILRYGIPYGPRMRDALVLPRFVSRAVAGEPITVHGDGSQVRNYVYVEDLAEAHVLALGEPGRNQVFNLEGAEVVSLRRLIETIGHVLGHEIDVEYVPARAGDYRGQIVSAEKAARVLDWQPEVGLEEGVRRYVEWYRDERCSQPATPERVPERVSTVRVPDRHVDPVATAGRTAAACGVAALVVPALTATRITPAAVGAAFALLALAIAGVAAWAVARLARSNATLVGAAVVVVTMWLLSQASPGWTTALLALAAGIGEGLCLSASPAARDRRVVGGATVGAMGLLVLRAELGTQALLAAGAVLGVVPVAGALLARLTHVAPVRRERRRTFAFASGTAVFTAVLASWVGATSASATWFGSLVSHGARSDQRVAITFDVSPSAPDALSITRVLDAYGVKATFFTPAETVEGDPRVSRALLSRGHLLGDDAYVHHSAAWLNPGYPDLAKAQRAFQRELGVCPTFFRPPHGRHTPLMARVVHHNGMTMVGWEVSPGEWTSHDGHRLARQVLRTVKPGSIIALGDRAAGQGHGRDAALLRALPIILDGLRTRGLRSVRLDELLHLSGYAGRCT